MITKADIKKIKTLKKAIDEGKPSRAYLWDDGKPDCLRLIDNAIEELENLLHNALETNRS